MVTAAGSMGSKSKTDKVVFNTTYIFFFQPENQKWKTLRI